MSSGTKLGTSVKLPYKGITQHIHFQLYNNSAIVDPTPFRC